MVVIGLGKNILLKSVLGHREVVHIYWTEACMARLQNLLTDGIFETGAYGVPSKSQNPTVLGQGGPSSIQCSNPSWACRSHHPFGTNNYAQFRHSIKTQVFSPALD